MFFILVTLVSISQQAFAQQPTISPTRVEALAKSPTWLRLIHWDKQADPAGPQILSEDFYLAYGDVFSPASELQATLDGLFAESASPPAADDSTQCRYPARFLWLSKQLALNIPRIECPRLEAWADFEHLDSVSLMLISGYFGNPASTFGHILLKINNGSIPIEQSLFDLGINYGALVPENEATLAYVLRGIFGGYEAGFSDQDFYRFDQTYSRSEYRDMWEYELQLSDYQQKMLLFHLWEIGGRKFRYFFVKGNCAYRLAELLELLTDENFVQDVDFWYAPVSVFHRLHQIDSGRSGQDKLIKSISYVPSARRVFEAYVDRLDGAQKQLLADSISDNSLPRDSAIEDVEVLDTTLRYFEYRLAAIPEEEGAALRDRKNAALLRRLQRPAAASSEAILIESRRSPAEGSAPSHFSVGGGNNEAGGNYAFVHYAPFSYDTVGNNSLRGSSISVVDMAASVNEDGRAKLEYFDLFRARKVNLNRLAFLDESAMSWEVASGARQESNGCDRCLEAFAMGRLGRAYEVSSQLKFSLMGGLTVASHGSSADAVAALIIGESSRAGAEVRSEYRYFGGRRGGRLEHTAALRVSLSQNTDLRLSVSDKDGVDGRLYLTQHF